MKSIAHSSLATKLRADELFLIALAINVDSGEMFKELFRGLGLRDQAK